MTSYHPSAGCGFLAEQPVGEPQAAAHPGVPSMGHTESGTWRAPMDVEVGADSSGERVVTGRAQTSTRAARADGRPQVADMQRGIVGLVAS